MSQLFEKNDECSPAGPHDPFNQRRRHSFHSATQYLKESEFATVFRMLRPAFFTLLEILKEDLARSAVEAARVVEPAVRLGITLRLLSGASY